MSEEYEESGYIECDDMPIYAQVPMWITLANIPPQSKIAWIFLSEHANVARQMGKKRIVAPKMDTIAEAIGTSRQRLRKFLKALVDIGALEQHQYRYAGGMRRGYTYKIRSAVPAGYSGPTSLGEYYSSTGGYQFEWMEHRTEGAEKAISAGQAGGVPMTPTGGYLKDPVEGSPSVPAEGDQKSPAIRSDRRSKPFVGGSSVLPPPPPSSVGAGEGATPEAPLEEDEEIESNEGTTPSAPPQGALSQEREDERELLEDAGSAVRLPVGFEEVRVVLDRLPRLEAAHVTTEGRLWGKIVEALGSGWDPVVLAKVLTRHTDADKARSVRVLPDWYANAFDSLPERPVKPVVPLCGNPAHQLSPQEDPVNGGCLLCNTQAATGPREKTTVASDTVRDPQDDGVAFGQAFRADLRAKRLLRTAEPSRSDTPQVRAHREAERNRVKANDLLRTER